MLIPIDSLALEFVERIFQDIGVAHQLETGLGIGKLAAGIRRIEDVECAFGRNVELFRKHHDNRRLFAPKDVITHGELLSAARTHYS